MKGVAAGLSHLHAQTPPIAHGDLKGVRSCFLPPLFCCTTCTQSTIFVSPTGIAILSDIGIASIPRPPEWDFKTGDDARWLAPEVMYPPLRPEVEDGEGFQASKNVTCESDVYVFAMASYEMCTRDLPFAPIPPRSVMIAVIQGVRPPRPSTEQSPQLTDCLWAIIQESWAQKYPDRRSCLLLPRRKLRLIVLFDLSS
ncbi:kinase-like domain-containing protein [Mycena olivaceomarginata]|nr:kinase-like domain-containing protein [Mycena olivaceomarginata]